MIGRIPQSRVLKVSDWILTEPVGVQDQDWYVNGVLALETTMPALLLLERLLEIETAMGRVRRERWGSRIIDLDLLLYGGDTIDTENCKVPHPRMHLRRFVLVPLMQMDPDLRHPFFSVTVAELLDRLPEDDQAVKTIKET